jgi:hypothetical protein
MAGRRADGRLDIFVRSTGFPSGRHRRREEKLAAIPRIRISCSRNEMSVSIGCGRAIEGSRRYEARDGADRVM